MLGAIDIRNVGTQLQSPVQKTCLLAAGSHVGRKGLVPRHLTTHQHPELISDRHSRLKSSVARSSKDDGSSGQLPSDPNEQQGVGRKQFLRVLSSEHPPLLLDSLHFSFCQRSVLFRTGQLHIGIMYHVVQVACWRHSLA